MVVYPGEVPAVKYILPDLASLGACVGGGYLKHFVSEGHVDFWANEEGPMSGMPFNRVVTLSDNSKWDIFGPILVLGTNDGSGSFESLTDEDVAAWMPRLSNPI